MGYEGGMRRQVEMYREGRARTGREIGRGRGKDEWRDGDSDKAMIGSAIE